MLELGVNTTGLNQPSKKMEAEQIEEEQDALSRIEEEQDALPKGEKLQIEEEQDALPKGEKMQIEEEQDASPNTEKMDLSIPLDLMKNQRQSESQGYEMPKDVLDCVDAAKNGAAQMDPNAWEGSDSGSRTSTVMGRRQSGEDLPMVAEDLKDHRYPSFLKSRQSVDMSACSSPDAFGTLQRSPSRRASALDIYPPFEPEVVETLNELDEYRKKCEAEGNYLEANAAAARLSAMKISEDNKRRAAMLDRHYHELEMAKDAYKSEIDDRNRLWDEKLKTFHREVMDHAAELKRQQMKDLEDFRLKMLSKTPSKPQWSRELLKLRKVQDHLGKQGKYLEAQEMKAEGDRMEAAELEVTLQAYHNEIFAKEHALRAKQASEMEVLLQRASQARDELRKNKAQDLDRCHQRHRNVERELKTMHANELFKFDQVVGKIVAKRSSRISIMKRNVGKLSIVPESSIESL